MGGSEKVKVTLRFHSGQESEKLWRPEAGEVKLAGPFGKLRTNKPRPTEEIGDFRLEICLTVMQVYSILSVMIRGLLICVVLGAITLVVFWPVRGYDFVNFDDPDYIIDNTHLKAGFSGENIKWAFTSGYASNWHPVTWLSHILDYKLFGADSGKMHLVSLFIHILNVLLLFYVLERMTLAVWPSAVAAALFAIHPLHVESVAWVAERKDVLSTFFGMLTLVAYLYYVRRGSKVWYGAAVVLFAIGLMAKPMLVTVPLVLLLLDYWPLGRLKLERRSVYSLVAEKIPFFVLSAGSCIITFIVQKHSGAVRSTAEVPLAARIANVPVAYLAYIRKMVWPEGLAAFYPHPIEKIAFAEGLVAVLVLAAITYLVIRLRDRKYLAVGWLWYLGTLVPVIGIVQVGGQAYADRYTYMTLVGLFIIIAWGAADLAGRMRERKIMLGSAAVVIIAVLAILARVQVGYWRDSITLFEHAIAVTKGNYIAHFCISEPLRKSGRYDEAIAHNLRAVEISPKFLAALNGLGVALAEYCRPAEAVPYLRKALEIYPDYAEAHINLGVALDRMGRSEEAIGHLSRAIELNPDNVAPMNNLAWILAVHKGAAFYNPQRAVELAERACRLTEYKNYNAMDTLGAAYAAKGDFSKAVSTAKEAIRQAEAANDRKTAKDIQGRLSRYETGEAFSVSAGQAK